MIVLTFVTLSHTISVYKHQCIHVRNPALIDNMFACKLVCLNLYYSYTQYGLAKPNIDLDVIISVLC